MYNIQSLQELRFFTVLNLNEWLPGSQSQQSPGAQRQITTVSDSPLSSGPELNEPTRPH